MSFRSLLATLLTPDNPVALVANWFLDKNDRQRLDAQILTLQSYVAGSLIRGQQSSWAMVDSGSATVQPGDCLCSASVAATEDNPDAAVRFVTRALASSSMSTAGVVAGVALTVAPPGSFVRYAYDGILGPSVTGLAAGASGHVRLNHTTARCERVASFSSFDFPVGHVDGAGNLTFARGLAIP